MTTTLICLRCGLSQGPGRRTCEVCGDRLAIEIRADVAMYCPNCALAVAFPPEPHWAPRLCRRHRMAA